MKKGIIIFLAIAWVLGMGFYYWPNDQEGVKTISGLQFVGRLSFNPDGSRLVSSGYYNTDSIWDTETGKLVRPLPGNSHPREYSPDGKSIASIVFGETESSKPIINISEAKTGKDIKTFKVEVETRIKFTPDGRSLIGGARKQINVWDVTTGQQKQVLKGHPRQVCFLAISLDGRRIAAGSYNSGIVTIWDANSGAMIQSFTLGGTECIALSPDGKMLAIGGSTRVIKLFDVQSGKLLKTLGHKGTVTSVAFHPHGKRLVSGSEDCTIKLWDVRTGQLKKTLEHHDKVTVVTINKSGTKMASGTMNGTIKIWDLNKLRVN